MAAYDFAEMDALKAKLTRANMRVAELQAVLRYIAQATTDVEAKKLAEEVLKKK